MISIMDFFSVHKWTLMQLSSMILTVPVLAEMPEGFGVMGVAAFLFATWRQWKEERRKQELHEEHIGFIRDVRSGKIQLDPEEMKEIFGE